MLCGGLVGCADDTMMATSTTAEPGSSSGSTTTTTTTTTTSPTTGEPSTGTTVVPTTDGSSTDPTTDATTGTGSTTMSTGVPGKCGDGILDAGEECDDGNLVSTDECTATCKNAACGDGIVLMGTEECDDGNAEDGDDCTNGCTAAVCGDGVLQMGVEACDDGNAVDLDGCTSACEVVTCSDGGPTRGSAIAISPDDSRLVVANRESGTVTVMAIDYGDGLPELSVVKDINMADEIPVGSEPWQVALDKCGVNAYVVLRDDQKVVEIKNVHGVPELGAEVAVGSEPTSLALTPNSTKLYVANWVDGTLSVIDPATMTQTGTVDLNAPLVAHPKKFLGAVNPRVALAHPRAIAITGDKDGSDDDEKVYVTEYFAQRIAPEMGNGSNADVNHEGLVYSVSVADDAVKLIELPPITDTGFPDANMGVTGCYPNQVQSVTVDGNFAYVTSTCASPEGPIGFKNNTHPMVSVINTMTDAAVPAGTSNLTKNWSAQYTMKATPDTSARRFPHIPNDVGFLPASGVAYLAANGADAVFRIVFNQNTGALQSVGNAMAPDFIDLSPAPLKMTPQKGQNPIGIAVANTHPFAFVSNDVTMNVSAIDFAKQIVAGSDANDARVAQSSPLPMDAPTQAILRGKHFFNTGLTRWSLNGQAWGSCQACHVDGLTDNVTWYFGRGPRQSTSLDASYAKGDPSDRRIFNWTAVFDEIADFEGNTRGTSGGVGALVSFADANMEPKNADRIDLTSAVAFPPASAAGLNGSALDVTNNTSVLKEWNDIVAYVQTIRPPRAPTGLDPAMVSAGETLFKDLAQGGVCQGCHSGPKWTISRLFYTPSGPNNQALLTKTWNAAALIGAGFPMALLPATTMANQVMRFGGAPNDQLMCIVRPVGTFGVAPAEVGIAELRQDMTTAGQGNATDGKGYNPPSLLGLGVGGPFFHAGNARTLEESFTSPFGPHWKALTKNANFLAQNGDVDKIVAYLLSIDIDKATIAIPPVGPQGGNFCAFP